MLRWMILVLLATPATGQDRQIIDYDALFRDKAAEVVTTQEGGQDARRLALPNGVTVTDTGGGIVAMDQSEGGAVGCLYMIYVDLGDALRACPALGDAASRQRHADYMGRINAFVAANAYPPMSLSDMEALTTSYQGRADAATCDRFDDADMAGFVENFLGPDAGQFLDKALATPRLPVNNPCL
jgi:hypothetical protein